MGQPTPPKFYAKPLQKSPSVGGGRTLLRVLGVMDVGLKALGIAHGRGLVEAAAGVVAEVR